MKRALVVGCANNLWRDVAAARELCGAFDAVYCVKMAGVHWPAKFKVWATLHPEFMDEYEKQRHRLGLPNGYEIVAPLANELGTHGKKGNVTRRLSYRWPGMNSGASSGIYAAKVALDDGYQRVVLAGVPMTKDGGHFSRGRPWLLVDCHLAGFHKSIPHMQGKVKSMSGLTAELLGAPTAAWLAGET